MVHDAERPLRETSLESPLDHARTTCTRFVGDLLAQDVETLGQAEERIITPRAQYRAPDLLSKAPRVRASGPAGPGKTLLRWRSRNVSRAKGESSY